MKFLFCCDNYPMAMQHQYDNILVLSVIGALVPVIAITIVSPAIIILQRSLEGSVRRTSMDARRFSALMELSAWTSLLLGWGQSADPALPDTQEMHRSAMVSLIKKFNYGLHSGPFINMY